MRMILTLINQFIYQSTVSYASPDMTPETVGLPDYEDVAIETADGLTLSA
jgi:hypothetical protein